MSEIDKSLGIDENVVERFSISKGEEVVVVEQGELLPILEPEDKGVVDEDFNLARTNIKDVLKKGSTALDSMLEIAKRGQESRQYEVVADLIKTLTQTNKDLIDLSRQAAELKGEVGKTVTNHNNLFVGSSAELLALIKSKDGKK